MHSAHRCRGENRSERKPTVGFTMNEHTDSVTLTMLATARSNPLSVMAGTWWMVKMPIASPIIRNDSISRYNAGVRRACVNVQSRGLWPAATPGRPAAAPESWASSAVSAPSGKSPMSSGCRRIVSAAMGIVNSHVATPRMTHDACHPNVVTNTAFSGTKMMLPMGMPIV